MASLLAPDDKDHRQDGPTKKPFLQLTCSAVENDGTGGEDEEDVDVVNSESSKQGLGERESGSPTTTPSPTRIPASVPSWLSPMFPVDPQILARYYETMAAQHHARRLQALQQLQVRHRQCSDSESLSVTSID